MDKAKASTVIKQVFLLAVMYPACLVALLSAVTTYVSPPLAWVVGLAAWAILTIVFVRFGLGVRFRRSVFSKSSRIGRTKTQ